MVFQVFDVQHFRWARSRNNSPPLRPNGFVNAINSPKDKQGQRQMKKKETNLFRRIVLELRERTKFYQVQMHHHCK